MKKSLIPLLLSTLITTVSQAFGLPADTVTMGVAPSTPRMTVLTPDFAYPADVITVADDFIASHAPNVSKADGDLRLLAAQELVRAKLSIDRMDVNNMVAMLLDMADKEPLTATRAMFLAYAATVCRENRRNAAGYLDTPVPGRIDDWGRQAFSAAADSLFNLAFNTAPSEAPLYPYAAALRDFKRNIGLLRTVRDFISAQRTYFFREHPDSGYASSSPIGMYAAVREMNNDSLKRDFITRHIESPAVEYAVAAWLPDIFSKSCRLQQYELLRRLKQRHFPQWLAECVDSCAAYFEQPSWTMHFPSTVPSFRPLEVSLSSANTDSIVIALYRFDRNVSDLNMIGPKSFYKNITFSPHSGVEFTKTTHSFSLPEGNYVAVYTQPDGYRKYARFVVTPWDIVCLQTRPDTRMIQVLDTRTGTPVTGMTVKTESKGKKKRTLKARTDADGIARFDKPINDVFTVQDPRTGLEFTLRAFAGNAWESEVSVSKTEPYDHRDITLVTDRTLYAPGDTVKWMLIARLNNLVLPDYADSLKVSLPDDSGNPKPFCTVGVTPTDRFGRSSGSFVIPAGTHPGNGSLKGTRCYLGFRVSDFRLPELSIKDSRYIFEGDSVVLSGTVCNNIGAPRPETQVRLLIDNKADTTFTDATGVYRFPLPRRYDKTDDSRSAPKYVYYTVEATTPDGYNATIHESYQDYLQVQVSLECETVIDSGKGVSFSFSTKRLGSLTPDEPVKCRWFVTDGSAPYSVNAPDATHVLLEGTAMPGDVVLPQSFTDTVAAGHYYIIVVPHILVGQAVRHAVTFYNPARHALPDNQTVWLPQYTVSRGTADSVPVEIGIRNDNTCVWWMATSTIDGTDTAGIHRLTLDKGYHRVNLPAKDIESVTLWCVSDGDNDMFNIYFDDDNGNDDNSLSLSLESFREKVYSGTRERLTFVTRRNGMPVSAALAVNIFEQRLTLLGGEPYFQELRRYLPFNGSLFRPFVRFASRDYELRGISSRPGSLEVGAYLDNLLFADWRYYSTRPEATRELRTYKQSDMFVSGYATTNSSTALKMAMVEQRVEAAGNMADECADADASLSTENVAVREKTIFNALWSPMLTTDSVTGTCDIDFVIPNQASTWILRANAWTVDLASGHLTRTFRAAKPLLVKPNMPRFVRVGDRVDIVTAITNTTDSTLNVVYDVTVSGGRTVSGKTVVGPAGTGFVTTAISVDGAMALQDSLSFTFRATDGMYGDGEKITIPILPSSALVVDSYPFRLNPSDTSITLDIPAGNGSDDETELHFTSNPLWTVVEAIPTILSEYETLKILSTRCAQAWYVAAVAAAIADNHPAARTVIDLDSARKAEKEALMALRYFQQSDGGFCWGQWSTRSSIGITLAVLNWLDEDTTDPQTTAITAKALNYLDNNIVAAGHKPGIDMHYTMIRTAFGQPETVAGRQVVANTVNHIVRNWKSMSLNDKRVSALILERNGRHETAATILRSVLQYGTVTPDRGMVFRNMPGVTAYANLLTAMYSVMPGSPAIDAVRQALVCQRRGYAWENTASTAYAIRAMVQSGTEWLVEPGNVDVTVDGLPVTLPETTSLTGAFTIPVNGDTVTVTRTLSVPAYGALVSRRYAPLADTPAHAIPEMAITKTLYTLNPDGSRTDITASLSSDGNPGYTLSPGQEVIVCLRIKADTEMTDIIVTDNRPATLAPVNQTGIYRRSPEGTWYYVLPSNAVTDIYIERLQRGYTTVEYSTTVNNTGLFTTGTASVTSALDAALTAHTSSTPFLIRQ